MPKLPSISGKKLIPCLEKIGFKVLRVKGSHFFLKHPDGRITIIPVHANEDLGIGILSSILKDCKITRDELLDLLK